MSWKLARSLDHLRDQLDQAAPKRSTASDGSIGDTDHQARKSDHNPDSEGVVRAVDITNDPSGGLSCETLAESLRASQDSRIKYVIWNQRIFSSRGKSTRPAWNWGKFSGSNPHTRHVHISINGDGNAESDTGDWNIQGSSVADSSSLSSVSTESTASAVSVTGMPEVDLKDADSTPYRGAGSKQLQGLLLAAGLGPKGLVGDDNMPDGECSALTKELMGEFQVASGTGKTDGTPDYFVGTRTWAALLGLSGQLDPSVSQGLSAPLDTAGVAATFTAPFGVGSSGAQVAAIQSKLLSSGYTVETNGEFGERTERAVMNFQKVNGREPNGHVDATLWRLLDLS